MPSANPIVIQDDLLSAIPPNRDDRAIFSEVLLSRLDIVSQYLAGVEAAVASVTPSTLSEFESIFASLSLEPPEAKTQHPTSVSPTQWLLDNLHNPYPPTAAKRAMEESSELGRRNVNEWFSRARQRIGWTRLLRDRFAGCRSAATDAAFRAFVRDDPRSPLDVELYAAFMAVKAHANLVYSLPSDSRSTTSPPSRSSSVAPSLTHSTDSEDSDSEISRQSRKRKRSCSELPCEARPASPSPRKRRLVSPPSPQWTSITSLIPSPPVASTDNNTPSPPRSRKRRLSESNSDEPTVKKPRGSDWAPRKQTVSDPLPLSAPTFDLKSWCNEAFIFPPSASVAHPVPDALDFELFNFEAFPAVQPADITDPSVNTHTGLSEQPDTWLESLFTVPNQTEKDLLPTSWEAIFNFELPCQSSLPSLTNSPSPSTPDTQWSVSPPELPYFESFERPPFDFSSPSLSKIPLLYPANGVEIVDSTPLLS